MRMKCNVKTPQIDLLLTHLSHSTDFQPMILDQSQHWNTTYTLQLVPDQELLEYHSQYLPNQNKGNPDPYSRKTSTALLQPMPFFFCGRTDPNWQIWKLAPLTPT